MFFIPDNLFDEAQLEKYQVALKKFYISVVIISTILGSLFFMYKYFYVQLYFII